MLSAHPPLVPIIHADDCGLSAGITDAILACFDRGWLRRTSVVVNGNGWGHAVAELRRRPTLALSLHLNLFEGRPLSNPSEVDLLVDERGEFYRGFAALCLRGLSGAHAARLRVQIRGELRRQIERFLAAFGDRAPLLVDGHIHFHVLPMFFDELLELCAEYPIAGIRLPRERFCWPAVRSAPRVSMLNLTKCAVLRALCRRADRALRARGVTTTDAFIGVIGTGAMTLEYVSAALNHLHATGTSGTVEILFHPGRARADEASLWNSRPALQEFYLSEEREREAELLRSTDLGRLLGTYRAAGSDLHPARSAGFAR
jgi:predicted glycoside hydrolase/deacetylase ChbG (UPF0249 family)